MKEYPVDGTEYMRIIKKCVDIYSLAGALKFLVSCKIHILCKQL